MYTYMYVQHVINKPNQEGGGGAGGLSPPFFKVVPPFLKF